jgi:hypothetical protein
MMGSHDGEKQPLAVACRFLLRLFFAYLAKAARRVRARASALGARSEVVAA